MKSDSKADILRKALWWGLLTIIAAFYIVLWNLSLPQLDDYMFKGVYLHYADNFDFDLTAFWKSICEIRQGDNGRIPNITGVMFSSMGIWPTIFPWITGLLMTAIVFMGARLATARRIPNAWDMALVWTLLTIFLPWRNYLIAPIYALNYVYSTFLALLFLTFMLRWQRKGYPLSNLWWLLPLAFLTAGWHEGIAIPLAVGLFVQTLVARNRNRRWWLVGCFFALSILPFVLSPGLMGRSGCALDVWLDTYRMLIDYIPLELLTAVLIFMAIIPQLRKKLISLLKRPALLVLLVAAYTAALFSPIVGHSPRMAFFPAVCSSIWLIAVFLQLTGNSRVWTKFSRVCAAAGVVLCCFVYTTAIYWQHKFYVQRKAIITTIERENTGTVFYDVIDFHSVPSYTLYIPTRTEWEQPFNYVAMNETWPDRHIAVVPTTLRGAQLKNATVLGNDSVIHRFKGQLIAPYSVYRDMERRGYQQLSPVFSIRWMNGGYDEYLGFVLPFKPGEGLDSLSYINIFNADPSQIKSVEIRGLLGKDIPHK